MREKRANAKKSENFQGGHDKIDWKSRVVNFKKIDILNMGGTIFFWKSPILLSCFPSVALFSYTKPLNIFFSHFHANRHIEERGCFMNGYSLLNISYGSRKQQRKKKEKPSQSTIFQQKITNNEMTSTGAGNYSGNGKTKKLR